MINDFEIDQDGFDSEIQENKDTIVCKNLSYEQLLDFAALMMTERNYAEGLYQLEKLENDWQRGVIMNSYTKDEAEDHMRKAFSFGKKEQVKATAKHAVSHREDQILKLDWMKHVKSCVANGCKINNINDLLDIPGYDPRLSTVQAVTLKAWAKEAVPSLKFKAGRPR